MFSNPKAKFIFQLICSIITLPLGVTLVISILDGLFGVDVSAVYNFLESGNPDSAINQFANEHAVVILIVALVIHILAFIGSGGAKYSFVLYCHAVKTSFFLPIPILNIILGVIVAVVGLVFVVALAPIFAFYSTIKNYVESKSLVY